MASSYSLEGRKTNRLQTVPWFERNEWLETYRQAYSKDEELQDKAYTQMCIWKTRYPNLPLGVECTMSMLHVKLCDKQSQSNTTYKDRDLQLLYSTAVMRFLNQLTVMSNCKDSMYKMAEQHQIPDWLINLRHEAAHGNSVPALYLLRQASDIILQWLQENYWKTEANVMTDVIRSEMEERASSCGRINELLKLWIELKIHYWAGRKTIDRIPCEQLRAKAMELASEEGFGLKIPGLKDARKPVVSNESNNFPAHEITGYEKSTESYTHRIKTAFEPLLRRLFNPLNGKKFKKIQYQECLISCLTENKGFCLDLDPNQIDEPSTVQLICLLGELWKEVLRGLQSNRLLHCLIRALMSGKQLPVAHLWLRLLTQLLLGQPLSPPPSTAAAEPACRLLADNLPCHVDTKVLLQLQYRSPCGLKAPSAQETQVLQQLAEKVLENPCVLSFKYLDSLLCFWKAPLSVHTMRKLCAFAGLYCGAEVKQIVQPVNVHTVASLIDQGLFMDQTADDDMDDTIAPNTSPWELYIGNADWSKCALGILPWENDCK